MISLEQVAETSEMKSIANEQDQPSETQADILANLKIVKNAQCKFNVVDVDSATTAARKMVAAHSGYISDMRFKNTQYQLENRFTIRVPQSEFEPVLAELSKLAKFTDYKNITSTDVSEEYVDLNTRLQTKLEIKKRYDEILRSKAKTVEEVLLAEEKLRVLQEEIEAAQGRLKFLSNKVALSTIQVDLYETVIYKDEPDRYKKSFAAKAKNSVKVGWSLVKGFLLVLLYIWPLWIIAIAFYLFLRYRKKGK